MGQRGRKSAASLAVVTPAAPDPVVLGDPPRPLGRAGLALWHRVLDHYDVDAGAAELLLIAAEATDRAEMLAEAITADGAVVRGESGSIKDHPGLKHETANRALAARLLSRIGVAP
jgi:hypothetical protein